MPEGDTVHYAANRIRPVLEGRIPEHISTPQPRHRNDRWAERLQGRAVHSVDAHGKHLFVRFEGGYALHSHLRMTGAWSVYRQGQRWRRSPRRAWLVLCSQGVEVVQFDGPILELVSESRARSDTLLKNLGPDILGAQLDLDLLWRRLREDDPIRPIGDALLDQRTLAGIGNIWKAEACFAAGLSPWRAAGEVSREEFLAVAGFARERMSQSARDGFEARPRSVYGSAGAPCPRCATPIRKRGQGEQNRMTYWCPGCQR